MIDSRAIIDSKAELASDVVVGPWSVIGAGVKIDSGTQVGSHVVIKGPTTLGKNNRIFQFASVGEDCQDKKYNFEPTTLVVGDNNIIREGVTLHRGTVQDTGTTIIGNNNLFMAYVHVAHDCVVGSNIVMANNTAIAGHVHIGDWTILGGFTAVHQFCHIGEHVMCGTSTVVLKDIPSYIMASGNSAKPYGINVEGLKRRGFTPEAMKVLRQAYKIIYRKNLTLRQALAALNELAQECQEVMPLIRSLETSKRGIIR